MPEANCPSASTLTRYPAGVLSSTSAGGPRFLPLFSFQSVSFNPTLILLSVENTPENWSQLEEVGSFAVSFSSFPFGGSEWLDAARAPSGAAALRTSPTFQHPLPPSGAAWVECAIDSMIETDDRIIVLASMIDMEIRDGADEPVDLSADEYPPLTKSHAAE